MAPRLTEHLILVIFFTAMMGVRSWTGEIHGRVVCDLCGDSFIGPEDHVLPGTLPRVHLSVWCDKRGAEVAVLCIAKSGEVLNYQAFTNSDGLYTVAETMPESEHWYVCLARPITSFDSLSTITDVSSGVRFSYNRPSGYSHTVRPFVYRPSIVPAYCM